MTQPAQLSPTTQAEIQVTQPAQLSELAHAAPVSNEAHMAPTHVAQPTHVTMSQPMSHQSTQHAYMPQHNGQMPPITNTSQMPDLQAVHLPANNQRGQHMFYGQSHLWQPIPMSQPLAGNQPAYQPGHQQADLSVYQPAHMAPYGQASQMSLQGYSMPSNHSDVPHNPPGMSQQTHMSEQSESDAHYSQYNR